jgi:hypothetical protein
MALVLFWFDYPEFMGLLDSLEQDIRREIKIIRNVILRELYSFYSDFVKQLKLGSG